MRPRHDGWGSILGALLALAAASGVLAVLIGTGSPAQKSAGRTAPPEVSGPVFTPTASSASIAAASPFTSTIMPPPAATGTAHLPLAGRSLALAAPRPRTWGTQLALEDMAEEFETGLILGLPHARSAGLRAIRTNLRWDWTEPADTVPAAYQWRRYDERIAAYRHAGFDVLVTILAFPEWATVYQCGYALRPGMDGAWREFVRALVTRYSVAPYGVRAWEIGNEVDGVSDVRPDAFERPPGWGRGEPTSPYGGCWGGRESAYAAFLRMAYEEIKSVDPGARVLIGGLGYADLMPVNGQPMFAMDFLDRALDAGAGDHFDVLSYHWFPDLPMQPSGPEKHRALIGALARHGLAKPVWLNETYRLSIPGDPQADLAQVRFLGRELPEMVAAREIERIYWYGWVDFAEAHRPSPDAPHRGLVRADFTTRPALTVLPHVVAHTNGVPEDISTGDVRAWRYTWRGEHAEHVVAWSADGGRLRLPSEPGAVAHVTYCPAEILLAGRDCASVTVGEADGFITLDVGSDTLFVTID